MQTNAHAGPASTARGPAYLGQATSTPLGAVWVAVSERGLAAVEIQGRPDELSAGLARRGFTAVLIDLQRTAEAACQVGQYLDGQRREFDLPLDWSLMAPFQQQVLRLTCAIPYGQTSTYQQLAGQLGNPRAARAVGRAEAANPMPLVIPCHRVVGTDGGLHGYGAPGGVATKRWLLTLEAKWR